jgi:hypothetical protein
MPPPTGKRRRPLEPISYDELLSNAGMSGFVSFLEGAAPAPDPAAAVPLRVPQIFEPLRRRKRQSRIWHAEMVEDGHSLAEQAVYEALWNAASPVDADIQIADRTIRIGYHRLARLTRLSWVSVKANLRSLEKKLAIEVIGSENSATQEGKTYLVYSRPTILERRKGAGLIWVRRTRGVELLTSENLPPDG